MTMTNQGLLKAAATSAFNAATRACASKNVNAWKININGTGYLVTPAHVAIHAVEGRWTFSKFLKDFKHLDWRLPEQYTNSPRPQFDFCWARLTNNENMDDFLTLREDEITEPLPVSVLFRQPFDRDGKWLGGKSVMGSTEATLYKSPSEVLLDAKLLENKDGENLLEAIDIGFRGMSGAVALSTDGKFSGMFVKRASLVALKECASRLLPLPQTLFSPLFSYIRHELGLDYLIKNCLMKDDLHELGVVFDARRGLFLPSTSLLSIGTSGLGEESVNNVVGRLIPTDMPKN